jgi:hypothetical protein
MWSKSKGRSGLSLSHVFICCLPGSVALKRCLHLSEQKTVPEEL